MKEIKREESMSYYDTLLSLMVVGKHDVIRKHVLLVVHALLYSKHGSFGCILDASSYPRRSTKIL